MPAKKKFLLRLDPAMYGALEKWAADEFRSVNGQIEFLLQDALRRARRREKDGGDGGTGGKSSAGGDESAAAKGAAGGNDAPGGEPGS